MIALTKRISTIATIASCVLCSSVASAENKPAETNYVPWAPGSEPKPQPAPEILNSDHEEVRLRPGFGYFGRIDAPLGQLGARASESEPVHLIGFRVWFRRLVAFELAIGGSVRFGSSETSEAHGNGPSTFALAARTSLPIALVITKHLTLYVAPTLAYTQAGETLPSGAIANPITGLDRMPPETRHTGLRLAAGGRLGAEVQFGFLKIERLSLNATIGLDAMYTRAKTNAAPAPTTIDPEPAAVDSRYSRFSVRTSFADDAWTAILGNVALVAYF